MSGGVLDSLRRPAYTGENRCVPCTVLNVGLAVLAANAVTYLAHPLGTWPAVATGLLALAGCLAAIALRGYLVPGTPRLTKRYLPARVLDLFEPRPAGPPVAGTGGRETDADVDPLLVRAGATEECEDVDGPCLAEEFRAAWRAEMAAMRRNDARRREEAAVLHDADPAAIEIDERGTVTEVRIDGVPAGRWPAGAAMLADLAGSGVLGEWLPAWTDLDAAERGDVLYGLRRFLDRCPACGGRIEAGEAVVESCCRSTSVVRVSCSACGARIREVERPASSARGHVAESSSS